MGKFYNHSNKKINIPISYKIRRLTYIFKLDAYATTPSLTANSIALCSWLSILSYWNIHLKVIQLLKSMYKPESVALAI